MPHADLAPYRVLRPATKWVILAFTVCVGHGLAVYAVFAPEWKTTVVWILRGLIAIQVPIVGLVYLQRLLELADDDRTSVLRRMFPTEDHALYVFCALFFCTALGLATLVLTR